MRGYENCCKVGQFLIPNLAAAMTIHRFDHLPDEPEVDHDRADVLIEALERSLSAISHTRLEGAVAVMAQAASRSSLTEAFSRLDITGLPHTVLRHCASLRDLSISLEERLMVINEIQDDKEILLARAGLLDARDVVLAAAFSSDAKDFAKTWDDLAPFLTNDRQELLDTALSLCAYSQELDNGTSNTCDVEKVQTLIDLGANVMAQDIWPAVLENGEHDVKAAFIKAGADAGPYFEKVNTDRYSYTYLDGVLRQLAGTPVYMRLDDHTLEQVIFRYPVSMTHKITTVYRFDLGRVTEVQQDNDTKFPPQAINFADVPLATLETMRDRLVALGGKPLALHHVLRTSAASAVIKAPSR